MRFLRPKSQMTAHQFKTALRAAGFGVENGQIVDLSGTCPGFATVAISQNGKLDRNATLAKVIRERDIEIARREAETDGPYEASLLASANGAAWGVNLFYADAAKRKCADGHMSKRSGLPNEGAAPPAERERQRLLRSSKRRRRRE
jgi:hypothetical protein